MHTTRVQPRGADRTPDQLPRAGRAGKRWARVVLLGAAALLLCRCRAGVSRGELLLADGLERLALGDTVTALESLDGAAFAMPEDARAWFHAGRLRAQSPSIEERVQGEKLLRRAVELAPTQAGPAEALGLLLQRQGFHHEGAEQLRTAVRLDPRSARAWFGLGVEVQREWLDEPAAEALRDSTLHCFERVFALDPAHDEARYRLAFLHMVRGDLNRARDLVQPLVFGRDCPGRFGLLLSAIEFRSRHHEIAQSHVDATLACVSATAHESLLGLAPLLHPDSAWAYKQLPASLRDSVRTLFWWQRDPTPTTHVNERLLEHVSRVVDADFYFDLPRRRLGRSTDRGETYLRYGPPTVATRSADFDSPAWVWRYEGATEDQTDWEFVFLDRTHRGDFLRLKRGVGSDYMHAEAQEAAPELTRVQFPAPPAESRWSLRRFRSTPGRMAVEVAYEVPIDSGLERLQVEAAGWRGPDDLVGHGRAALRRDQLHVLGNGRAIGRLRFDVPLEPLEIGLQAVAMEALAGVAMRTLRPAWISFGRQRVEPQASDPQQLGMSDLLPAYDVHDGRGGPFDLGGVIVVPRVDLRIEAGDLPLYFEVYSPPEVLEARRALAVTYRVRALPPSTWSFGDQFRGKGRRQRGGRPAVEATFVFEPQQAVETQQLGLDLRNLAPGDYELTIELHDTAGGAPVVRSLRFAIAAPVAREAKRADADP
jgi:GWxTD domain-containing protein